MDNDKTLKGHKKIQKQLMDVYYLEKELSSELRTHLNTCPKCARYWEELKTLDNKLDVLETKLEIDTSVIRRAFEEADKAKIRKERQDFIAFLCIAASLLTLVSWIAFTGYGAQIILIQVVLMFITPISVPFVLSKRIEKEAKSK